MQIPMKQRSNRECPPPISIRPTQALDEKIQKVRSLDVDFPKLAKMALEDYCNRVLEKIAKEQERSA